MHGVGGPQVLECCRQAGFPDPVVVEPQFAPDPDFPTAPFPNPEEPGALDLALAQAADSGGDGTGPGIDVVLANDPDADRLAVAVPDRDGRWGRLTGDEVGALVADHLLRHRADGPAGRRGESPAGHPEESPSAVVASSIVSSRLIESIAVRAGVQSVRTLTGFKWVARPIVDHPDAAYLFGYEEALGYCVGDRVRDKDGISAALVMAEIVAEAISQGETLRDRLDRLASVHGLYATRQVTVRLDDPSAARRAELMATAAGLAPSELAGTAVVGREDLSDGATLPPTTGVVLDLDGGGRVVVRPSGTEPKIKAYLEVVTEPMPVAEVQQARSAANRRLDDLAAAVEAVIKGD
jgi:phosphomannomutase